MPRGFARLCAHRGPRSGRRPGPALRAGRHRGPRWV